MASFNRVTFNGSTDTMNVTFEYLDKSFVVVTLNGVVQVLTTDYTWLTDSQIKFTSMPANGVLGVAQRVTPSGPIVVFAPGNLDPNDLNVAETQAIHIGEEGRDTQADLAGRSWLSAGFQTGRTITISPEGYLAQFDAGGNLVGVIDAGDIGLAQGYALAAMGYRDEANTYANNAFSSKQDAAASASAAAGSAAAAAGAVATTLQAAAHKATTVAADRFIILNSAAGNAISYQTVTEFLSNNVFSTSLKWANAQFLSGSFRLFDTTANTKGMAFDLTSITAGQTRSLKMPDLDVDLGSLGGPAYTSAQQSWVAGTFISIAHGLGVLPARVTGKMVCITADAGYAVGEVLTLGTYWTSSGVQSGVIMGCSTTNVFVQLSTNYSLISKTAAGNSQITVANWKLILEAWKA